MRVFLIILCSLLLKQSFATCSIGPMFNKGHHQTTTAHSLTNLASENTKSCCKSKSKPCKADDKNHKNHSSDDGCGDDCHCACCAKVLLHNWNTSKYVEIEPAVFINEEKISSNNLYSFDYNDNIIQPPVA